MPPKVWLNLRPWGDPVNYKLVLAKSSWGLPCGSAVKNPPAMQEMWVQSLGEEYPLEEGMATHSNILAGKILWTEEPGGLQSIGPQSWTWLKWLSTFTSREQWQIDVWLKINSLFITYASYCLIFFFFNISMGISIITFKSKMPNTHIWK